jgi:hypothetical protein
LTIAEVPLNIFGTILRQSRRAYCLQQLLEW